MLRTQGRFVLDGAGQPILLRGMNAGGFGDLSVGWFMYGGWNETTVRNNLAAMKAWGMNCIRIMGTVRWWLENCREDLSGNDYLDRSFRDCFLDTIRLAEEYGINVIVTFWAIDTVQRTAGLQDYLPYPPRAFTQNYATIRDVNDFIEFWCGDSTSSAFLARFANVNTAQEQVGTVIRPVTSSHVHNNGVAPPSVMEALRDFNNVIYEFYNEPSGDDQGWLNANKAIIDVLRAKGDTHPVMVQCGYAMSFTSNSWYSKLKTTLQGRSGVIVSNHVYNGLNSTYSFGSQIGGDYPTVQNAILNTFGLQQVINDGLFPVIIGEIGITSSQTQFLRSALQVLNENQVGWSVWEWRSGAAYTGNFTPTANGQAVIDFLASLPTYTLTVLIGAGQGTTDPQGTGQYTQGQSVQVAAEAASGFQFDRWLLDGVEFSFSPVVQVQMDANHVLTAEFEQVAGPPPPPPPPPPPQSHTVVMEASEGGSTDPSGYVVVEHGATLLVTAIPDAGYKFDLWTINGSPISSLAIFNFAVTNDTVMKALFTEEPVIPPPPPPPPPECSTAENCVNKYGMPPDGQHYECQDGVCVLVSDPPKSGMGVYYLLPHRMLNWLWRLREKYIGEERHRKLHPLV